MLATCVLAPPPCTGKKHRHYSDNYTQCWLERCLDGERSSQWHGAHPRKVRPRNTAFKEQCCRKSVSLVEGGKRVRAARLPPRPH